MNQDGYYRSPDGRVVAVQSTMGVLFSDDFGGAAIDSTRWQVLDGGQGAVTLGSGATQAAIGSGITGITDSVSSSNLVVAMGTTLGAERWYLSTQTFAGSEDLLVLITKSQANVNNSVFIGLVEVDPATGFPLRNANIANDGNGSGDFNNRGGVELAKTATATLYNAEAVADGSSTVASSSGSSTGTAVQSFATAGGTEVWIEFESVDILASTCLPDSITGKGASVARVSTQCPNDGKAYKLLMRFRNTGTPTATTVTIGRVLIKDGQEFRAEISSGRGDLIAQKGVAVNVLATSAAALPVTLFTTIAGGQVLGFTASNSDATAVSAAVGRLEVSANTKAFNGTTIDRLRTSQGAITSSGVGILAVEEAGRSFQNITTATTTTVKSGAGFVHALLVNTLVASATITIYDSLTASGTKLGTWTLPSTITGVTPFSLVIDAAFGTGLTIVTSGATDITAVYR